MLVAMLQHVFDPPPDHLAVPWSSSWLLAVRPSSVGDRRCGCSRADSPPSSPCDPPRAVSGADDGPIHKARFEVYADVPLVAIAAFAFRRSRALEAPNTASAPIPAVTIPPRTSSQKWFAVAITQNHTTGGQRSQ